MNYTFKHNKLPIIITVDAANEELAKQVIVDLTQGYATIHEDYKLYGKLEMLFEELEENAYDIDTHSYYYKEANQIIRKYFEK